MDAALPTSDHYPTMIEDFSTQDLRRLPALQPAGWGPIYPHYEMYLAKGFGQPVKASRGGDLAGVANLISFGDKAWLSHVIVAPDYRRQGIATALVSDLLARADRMPLASISLIATDEGYPVYRRLGFHDELQYVFLEPDAARNFAPNPAIRPIKPHDHQAILAMDLQTCGEDRQELLSGFLDAGRVFERRAGVQGFWLPNLGEGLIVANHPEAGLELLKLKIGLQQKISLPLANQAACQFLLQNGYQETRRAWRMLRGIGFNWSPDCLYSRIGGNFG